MRRTHLDKVGARNPISCPPCCFGTWHTQDIANSTMLNRLCSNNNTSHLTFNPMELQVSNKPNCHWLWPNMFQHVSYRCLWSLWCTHFILSTENASAAWPCKKAALLIAHVFLSWFVQTTSRPPVDDARTKKDLSRHVMWPSMPQPMVVNCPNSTSYDFWTAWSFFTSKRTRETSA